MVLLAKNDVGGNLDEVKGKGKVNG